jgi:cyclic pyranopterin phosphate synthase
MSELSHVDKAGNPTMVDVSGKAVSQRTASAESRVELGQGIMNLLHNREIHTPKGPVFQTAIIAGTMAAKKTAELIPFCHPIGLENCSIDIQTEGTQAIITCSTTVTAKTGIEMEAITGASVAAITIYDMCKAMSHDIEIIRTRLISKTGGKQDYKRV